MRRPAPGAHLVLVVGVAALCWAWLQRVAAVARPGPLVCRSAFSAPECDAIGQAFLARPAEHDVRDDDGIRRTNRWDTSKGMLRTGELDWISERIVACANLRDAAGREQSALGFRASVDFSLMHEFGPGDFFDWHVDTTPGDGTGRTLNVNVMLSDPTRDFEGGHFLLGATRLTLAQGDLYIYPASYPHAVQSVTAGRRHTLVVGLVDPPSIAEPDAQARLMWSDMQDLRGRRGERLYDEPLRAAYWRDATANLDAIYPLTDALAAERAARSKGPHTQRRALRATILGYAAYTSGTG